MKIKPLLTSILLILSAFTITFAQGTHSLERNIPYYPVSGNTYQDSICTLDIHMPAKAQNLPVLVWFHGGGLSGGQKDMPRPLLNQQFIVVTAGYRLHPKVTHPTYIADAAAVIAWVFRNISRYGGDPDKIVLSGHSAGGYLAMMTGMDSTWLAASGIKNNRLAALIPLSGQCITHFTIRKETGIPETQPTIDRFAPLFHVHKDLPKLILITGDREKELLGRYEENAYLARMMKITGNTNTELFELEGFNHGEMVEPGCLLLVQKMRQLFNLK